MIYKHSVIVTQQVLVIDATGLDHLTEGKIYIPIKRTGRHLTVIGDDGNPYDYLSDRFEDILLPPKVEQLKKLTLKDLK